MDENVPKLCADILSSKGGIFVTITDGECPRKDVPNVMTFGQSVKADPYKAGPAVVNSTPENKAIGKREWNMSLRYLEEGKLKTPPIELREGLEGTLAGIDDLRKGLVSGRKIVSQLV